jgi:hypothetical protein
MKDPASLGFIAGGSVAGRPKRKEILDVTRKPKA